MSDIQQSVEQKLAQAKFFYERLSENRHDAVIRSYFLSAFLSSFRSVVLYVKTRLEREDKIKCRADWKLIIEAWEKTLTPDQREKWQCLTRLRNDDIHEEPVIPNEHERPSMFGASFFPRGYFPPGYFGGGPSLKVKHPESGTEYDVFDACTAAIQAAEKLIVDHSNL